MKNILVRLLACVLVLTMVFAFAACTAEEEPKDPETNEDPKDPVDDPKDPVDDPKDPVDPPVDEPEKCPDCGKPVDECECEEESPYTPFTCPTSSSTIYGKTTETNALSFNDVWGQWEVITEGDNAGAVHAKDAGANIALINNVDFTKAKKITISCDFMLPANKSGNNNYGFVLDVWQEPGEDTFFYWEEPFNSYFYCLQSGGGDTGTLIGKWGATTAGVHEKWYGFNNPADTNFAYTWTNHEATGLEFNYGNYHNIKVEYDCENEVLTMFYNDVKTYTVDFDVRIFANDGENGVGIRANRGDVYYKNINLIVE